MDATPSTTYSCAAGYELWGNTCRNLIASTPNTTYSCPAGYSLSGMDCSAMVDSMPVPPPVQSNLGISGNGDAYTLSWNRSSNAEEYWILVKIDGVAQGFFGLVHVIYNNNDTSISSSALEAATGLSLHDRGHTYSYAVRSCVTSTPDPVCADFVWKQITIAANAAPVVSQAIPNQSIRADEAFSYTFPANTFTDSDGDSLSYSASHPSWMSFSAGARRLSGTPPLALGGSFVDVTITATDTHGGTASDVVRFNITANRAPTVANGIPDQTFLMQEAFVYVFPADTFSDLDGDALTYTATVPPWLNFDAAERKLFGVPRIIVDPGYEYTPATTSVAVYASDGRGGSVYDSFVLQLVNRNDPPVLDHPIQNKSAHVGTPLSFSFPATTFSDPDGDSLSYSSTRPGWLQFDDATRSFSGTPPESARGANQTVTVTATDTNSQSVTDSFYVMVSANHRPQVANEILNQQFTIGKPFSFIVPANTFADQDPGTTLNYTATGLPPWMVFVTNTREFKGLPLIIDEPGNSYVPGNVSLTVSASDGQGGVVTDQFVVSRNDPPVHNPNDLADQSVTEGDTVSYPVPIGAFSDPDGDPLTWSGSGPSWLTFDPGTRTFTMSPPAGSGGTSVTATVSVDDQNGGIASASFQIVIDPLPNAVPVVDAGIDDRSTAVNANFTYTFPADAFSDPGDTLDYTVTSKPTWLTFNGSSRTFGTVGNAVPFSAAGTNPVVTVRATDSGDLWVQESFVITVPDLPPTSAGPIGNFSVTEGQYDEYTVPGSQFADPEGGNLEYTTAGPGWLLVDATGLSFYGTPPAGSGGTTASVTITAEDAGGQSVSESFLINIAAAPVVVPTVTASFNPAEVAVGDTASLTWSSTDTTSCDLQPGDVALSPEIGVATSGSWVYPLNNATGLSVTVTCSSGSESASATAVLGALSSDAVVTINPVPSPASLQIPAPSTASDDVGAIQGGFAVTPSGAATYEIPFATAPGTGGVAPQIGLRYSSGNGNGVAGVGTSLSGLSSIARCRQTLLQDNTAEPIRFDAGDRYCLDGQRLILVSANGLVDGAEFRTEIDSYRRITVHGAGTSSGNPDGFTVRGKDGSVTHYGLIAGTDSDGRHELYETSSYTRSGKVLTWRIAQFQDSVGNKIVYEYDTERQNLSRINYAYGAGATPGAYLEFAYDPREDEVINYVSGYKFALRDRLNRVTAYNSDQILRQYWLTYLPQTTGVYSRLEKVEACAQGVCLKPTTFGWTAVSATSTGYEASVESPNAVNSKYVASQPADLNGDGYMDLLWIGVQSSGPVELYASIFNPDPGSNEFVEATCPDVFTCGASQRFELSKRAQKTWRVVDYNGDGSQDVSFVDQSGYLKVLFTLPGKDPSNFTWEHLHTPGVEYVGSDQRIYVGDTDAVAIAWGDVNSDGLPDLIYRNQSAITRVRLMQRNSNAENCGPVWPGELGCAYILGPEDYSFSFGGSDTEHGYIGFYMPELMIDSQFKVTDFDGDGRVDFVAWQNVDCANEPAPGSELYFPAWDKACELGPYKTNYTAFRTESIDDTNRRIMLEPFGISELTQATSSGGEYLIPADINGDGLGDLLYKSDRNLDQWSYQLSNGSELDPALPLGTLTDDEVLSLQFGDVNRDGHSDLVVVTTNALKQYRWDQATRAFETTRRHLLTVDTGGDREHKIFDVNGDSRPDVLDIQYGNSTRRIGLRRASSMFMAHDKVNRIDNGLGVETTVKYEGLKNPANDGFYTRDLDAHEPAWDLSPFEASVESERPPTFDVSPAMYVVQEVCSSAPAAGSAGDCASGSNAGVARQSYTYTGAKLQAGGRGFLGFREVTVDDVHSNTYTVTEYRQDFPYTGRQRFVKRYHDNGTLLSQVSNNYNVSENSVPASGNNKDKVYNAYTWTASESTFDPESGSRLTHSVTSNWDGADHGYDAWGNLTYSVVRHFNGSDAAAFAEVISENEYGTTDEEKQLGRLMRAKVTHRREEALHDVVRVSTFTYYGFNAVDEAGHDASHKGLLATEAVSGTGGPDGQVVLATTTHHYDEYGNKAMVVQAGDAGESGGGQTRTQKWAYEQGRYLATEQTIFGENNLITTTTYGNRDARLGLPQTVTNIDGVVTTNSYGVFGRLHYQHVSTGAAQTVTYSSIGLSGNCAATAQYKSEVASNDGGLNRTCFDALGREVTTSSLAFADGYNRVDRTYNELGQVVFESVPYSGSASTSLGTTTSYDAYNRPAYVTLPDNGQTRYVYSGRRVDITNPKGQVRSEVRNGKGDLTRVTDEGGVINYTYEAAGNLRETTVTAAAATSVITLVYDALGRKTKMIDPDKGTWTYGYNQFGELVRQTNARNENTVIRYDNLGRKTSRTDYSGQTELSSTTWSYDQHGELTDYGKLLHVSTRDNQGNADYEQTLDYDQYGRLRQSEENVTGIDPVTQHFTYDQFGRQFQVYGASGLYKGVEYQYNTRGYRTGARESAVVGEDQKIWYEITSVDPRGNLAEMRLHAGPHYTTVTREYSADMGYLKRMHATDSVYVYQDWGDTLAGPRYDALGNLEEVTDHLLEDTYTYTYDLSLNHLKSETVGLTTKTYQYDGRGNIESNADVGIYAYTDSARPNRLTSYNGTTLTYDANGNITDDAERHLDYTAFDKPYYITRTDTTGTNSTRFAYGPDRNRFKQVSTVRGKTENTYYVAGLEIIQSDGGWEYRRNVDGFAQESTFRTTQTVVDHTDRYYYLHDHLGSIEVILNDAGYDIRHMDFAPFGQRRSEGNQELYEFPDDNGVLEFLRNETHRGFTGHEMLDAFGLIHMNGRVYDPKLGRFLSADPFVQFPNNTQSYNRYSYVLNNPLRYSDPSGHFVFTLAASIAVATQTITTTQAIVGAFAAAGFGDALLGGASVEDALKAGAISGVSAFAFSSIGGSELFGYAPGDSLGQLAVNATANGVVGGVINELAGGSFSDGFLSAGLTAFAKPGIRAAFGTGASGLPGRVATRAVLGGTISSLTGGKFANGAVTAAFSQLFNEELSLAHERTLMTGRFSPGPGQYATSSGETVSLSVNDYGALHDDAGQFYALNTDGSVDILASGALEGFYPESYLIGGAAAYKGLAGLKAAMGPSKQWIRYGPSYSHHLGQSVSKSIRWGASPIHGGKYLKQIPSPTMRRFNQWIRNKRLPVPGWRGKDPGHLHIQK